MTIPTIVDRDDLCLWADDCEDDTLSVYIYLAWSGTVERFCAGCYVYIVSQLSEDDKIAHYRSLAHGHKVGGVYAETYRLEPNQREDDVG